jgi:hypothetical protein
MKRKLLFAATDPAASTPLSIGLNLPGVDCRVCRKRGTRMPVGIAPAGRGPLCV